MPANRNPLRVLLISHETELKPKIQADPAPKMAKGFIRRGHDARYISYTNLTRQLSPLPGRKIAQRLFKKRVDEALCRFVAHYKPDIIFVGFSRGLDRLTVEAIRATAPAAILFGWDGDPWPDNNPGRIEAGCALDILFATNDGEFLDQYRQSGAKRCLFMPNLVDTDIDRKYEVGDFWKSNILWTGKAQHQKGIEAGEVSRQDVLSRLMKRNDTKIYGCDGYPKIGGIDYFYAISGARIGISINAINTVPLYHSDRFTHYGACGTLVLAKRVPETERLMEHKKHAVYFDTAEECMELADWYLSNEAERAKIASEGMQYCRDNYNAEKIVGYMLDAMTTGSYEAPWGKFTAS